MKSLDLKRLLKGKRLATLVSDLDTLVQGRSALSLYDAQGECLAGPASLSAQALKEILSAHTNADDRLDTPPAAATEASTRRLMIEGELVGILVANTNTASRLSAQQLDTAADLLTHVLIQALENRSLAQETLERYREINLLYRTQELIGAPLEIDQIADLILQESVRVIQAAAAALLLVTPDKLSFTLQAHHGRRPVQQTMSHTETIAGWVVRNRRPVIVNDVSADPRCGPGDAAARSLLCAPLLTADACLGALTLYDKAGAAIFTASDQKLLTALALQAANAIQTAQQVRARESRLKARIHELRIEIDEMRKQREVSSITGTDYFARLQQSAQELRREFGEG